MRIPSRVPLAWRNLLHDKRRFLVCVAGITFAALLMFMELGFWNALLDASVELIRRFNGQLVIVNKARYGLAIREQFTTTHLEQARGVEGVQAAHPLYLELQGSLWKNPHFKGPGTPGTRPIRVVAFNPASKVLEDPEVEGKTGSLQEPDTVLVDRKSKKDYGDMAVGVRRELAGRSVKVVGSFGLGTDFTTDGNVITSDQTFAKLFAQRYPNRPVLGMADVGVVQVAEGYDPQAVKRALEERLPREDVRVFTKEEFIGQERDFWQKATPIGFIFTFGLWMGFIVGMVICYQILSSDIADHLAEFATLKAIGYPNGYLTRVVLQEGLWLALLGFVPALALAHLLYRLLAEWTGLPLSLSGGRGGLILALTTAMCLLSGAIAIRKVQTADPAEVF
jgi:putative ABC transport system permease protein